MNDVFNKLQLLRELNLVEVDSINMEIERLKATAEARSNFAKSIEDILHAEGQL